MEIRLDGRSAVITGASKGIGLAMAKRFADSGADIAIVARRQPVIDEALAEIRTVTNGKVVGVSADVATAEGCKAAYEGAMKGLGKIDILVNNAGASASGPIETVTDDIWQQDLDLKLMGAVRMTRQVWGQMKERRWGRVINVLSIMAKTQRAGGSPSSVSRAAGLALTKVLSAEGAPFNVLVNALMVGTIMSDQIVRRHAAQDKLTLDEMVAQMGRDIPLGRIGRAEEFANAACFLCSDAASYITGVSFPVDGGKAPYI